LNQEFCAKLDSGFTEFSHHIMCPKASQTSQNPMEEGNVNCLFDTNSS